ncbi:hypothetical protein GCM10010193_25430 [Kitasatospora atroaurantiaca]|uniref:Methyltransferase family protein n=1 Tax=Kitasatospora atroaurantiaca TaxID=285545 RepID=A0A561F0J8_9ACTN|nr:methyltransferase domain-containing protein [Kitasatospora atroaurantiaca]TWE21387.1 methyltransferase family protein [Kitasatospora atroaurantiaca]
MKGEEMKACCAAAYSCDAVAQILGDSYHPGGTALTRRLVDALGLTAGSRVLDVACGRGTSALLLADAYRLQVDGLDYSATNIARAQATAEALELSHRATFTHGDAEQLPYPADTFDAVLSECALCTFPDKTAAAAEFTRVLRPGGRLGITDVTADPDRLPPELTTPAARIACIADARPLADYAAILKAVGLGVILTERHDTALTRMIDQIEARLGLLKMTAPGALTSTGLSPDATATVLAAARTAVADGTLGYALLIAERGREQS